MNVTGTFDIQACKAILHLASSQINDGFSITETRLRHIRDGVTEFWLFCRRPEAAKLREKKIVI